MKTEEFWFYYNVRQGNTGDAEGKASVRKDEEEKNFLRKGIFQKEQKFPLLVVGHPPVATSGSTMRVTAVTPGWECLSFEHM